MATDLARMIDHTLLKADATETEIIKLAQEAKEYNFASVCVNPAWVKKAADVLTDAAEVKVCTVINIGALKSKQYHLVESDIKSVVEAAKDRALTKVIIETSLLTDEEKEIACKLAANAGADFVKTSTGFSTGGATPQDIALMRKVVGPAIGVKASGGVRSLEDAETMIKAGATRIGASSGVAIINGQSSNTSY
jgi:deoxyribose-phosphate aldolase